MKFTLLLCALATCAYAAQPVLVRVTPETLAKLQQRDPMIRLEKPAPGEAKVTRPGKQSIIKQSTILHDGRSWTLVPVSAVVFIPENLKTRVNVKPVGNLLPWNEFLGKNRSWITTNEVSFEQAAGSEALAVERTEFWAKQDKIVVATHNNGPISVRRVEKTQTLTQR
jgi:hypothetical protein